MGKVWGNSKKAVRTRAAGECPHSISRAPNFPFHMPQAIRLHRLH